MDVSRWLRSKFCILRTKVSEGPKPPRLLPGRSSRPCPGERAPPKATARAARRLGLQEPGLQGPTVLRAQGRGARGGAGGAGGGGGEGGVRTEGRLLAKKKLNHQLNH